ncbi:MAG TPA: DUF1501 domain-containing protein, partial [Planctomycetaceae bacterium]|nr:DUF1501 domain-containing protein [Planctomycetaceae bacterium]
MSSSARFCDGVCRRDLLKVGCAGMLTGSLSLPQLLGLRASAADLSAAARDKAKDDVSLIILFLKGGLATIDTLDLKPDAPPEFRGEFNPINTTVPGMQICEHLPLLAKQAQHFALLRSLTHPNSDHGGADHYMLTGYAPLPGFNPNVVPNNQRPAHGSIVSKVLGPRGAVPPYVCLPKMHPSAGSAYLGSVAAPFVVEAVPNAPNFSVPDLVPPVVVDGTRLNDRRSLMRQVDRFQQSSEVAANTKARMTSAFRDKAFDLITSPATKAAFDIHSEPDTLRDEYGRHSLGQSCLMARRLIEAGVRCVTIDHSNWDTHNDNFNVLRKELLPQLDPGLSTLLRDLSDRSLLSKTLVVVMGEFGRTPR